MTNALYLSSFPLWLSAQKVTQPKAQEYVIEHPLVINDLQRYVETSLSIISAPAGFGKTTMLVGWSHVLKKNGVNVCWLLFDNTIKTPSMLASYILYALYKADIDIDANGITDFSILQTLPIEKLIALLIHTIEMLDEQIVFIIDNFELISDELLDQIIQPLLEFSTFNFHLSIATDNYCPLKKALFELQNKVIHITPEHLAFSKHDIKMFFQDELGSKTLEYIFYMTEGWPIAVQFFRKIFFVDSDNQALEQELKINFKLIDRYIIEKITNKFSIKEQQLLMEMAISESFGDDLKHYLGIHYTAFFSTLVKRISPLIIQLDKYKYKFNPIFKEYLLKKSGKVKSQYFHDIYLKAAIWFAHQGLLKPAIEYCIKANNPQKVLDIIESFGGVFMVWIKEGFSYLELILKRLDQCLENDHTENFTNSMTMHIYHCIVNIKSGNKQLADKDYSVILEHYSFIKVHLSNKEQKIIECELFLMKIILDFNKGKMLIECDCEQLKYNISQFDSVNYSLFGQYYNILCLGYLQRGRLAQALNYAKLSIDNYKKINSLYGEIYIYTHLGDISFAEGKSNNSAKLLHKAFNLTRSNFSNDKGMISSIQILTAELNYQQGKSAGPNIQLLLKQLEGQEAWFDIYFAGYITSSNIAFDQHGLEAAITLLDNAKVYLLQKKLDALIPSLNIQKMNLFLKENKLTQAKEQMVKTGIKLSYYQNDEEANIAWRETLSAAVTICKMYIMEGKISEVLISLEVFCKRASEENNNLSLLYYEILFCIAYQKINDETLSFIHLEKAISLYGDSGYIRPFIDNTKVVRPLLEKYFSSRYKVATSQKYPLLTQAKILEKQLNDYHQSIENLNIMTKREQEVLDQLALGFSNKVIANKINISANTVCFHLKNIFIKLQASNRLQAVKIAKKRKFISSE